MAEKPRRNFGNIWGPFVNLAMDASELNPALPQLLKENELITG